MAGKGHILEQEPWNGSKSRESAVQLFFTLHTKCPFCRDKDTTVFIVSLYPKGKTWWVFLYLSPEKDEASKRERERACLQFDITEPIKRTEIICHSSSADRILRRAEGLPDFLTVKLQSGSIVPRLRKEAVLITPSGQHRIFHLLESTSSADVCHACFSRTKPTALKRLNLYLFPAHWGILNCASVHDQISQIWSEISYLLISPAMACEMLAAHRSADVTLRWTLITLLSGVWKCKIRMHEGIMKSVSKLATRRLIGQRLQIACTLQRTSTSWNTRGIMIKSLTLLLLFFLQKRTLYCSKSLVFVSEIEVLSLNFNTTNFD